MFGYHGNTAMSNGPLPLPLATLVQAEVIAAATSLTATAGTTSAFAQAASLAVTKCGVDLCAHRMQCSGAVLEGWHRRH